MSSIKQRIFSKEEKLEVIEVQSFFMCQRILYLSSSSSTSGLWFLLEVEGLQVEGDSGCGWWWVVLRSITRDDVLWRGCWHRAHIRCVVWLFLICVLSSTQLIMNIMDISDISLYPLGPHTNQAANLPVRISRTSPYLPDCHCLLHHCGGREERCCPTEDWEHQYSIPQFHQVTSFIAWRQQDK